MQHEARASISPPCFKRVNKANVGTPFKMLLLQDARAHTLTPHTEKSDNPLPSNDGCATQFRAKKHTPVEITGTPPNLNNQNPKGQSPTNAQPAGFPEQALSAKPAQGARRCRK